MKSLSDRFDLPVRKYPWYLRWLLHRLQRRCQHWNLKADILEGCSRTYSIRWCETCGAFSIAIDGAHTPMRMPEPAFED